jgi:hypothetical protein
MSARQSSTLPTSGLVQIGQPEAETPLAKLLEWQTMAAGAYSKNTVRAQKADGAIFQAFCEGREWCSFRRARGRFGRSLNIAFR